MSAGTCPACGRTVAPDDTSCNGCSTVLVAGDAATHLTPDTGIQAHPEPYPPFGAQLGPFLSGRHVVQVVEVRGTWAHVFADGTDQGWVEGARLLPPIGALMQPAAAGSYGSTVALDGRTGIARDQMIGIVGALCMIVGALVTWTQLVSVNAFKFPVQFLFDNHTRSHDPRLGWFIVLFGILGLIASIARGADLWRTICGIFGVIIVALFLIQIASGLTAAVGPFRPHVGFSDIVGGGPWITGIGALVLGLSPLFK